MSLVTRCCSLLFCCLFFEDSERCERFTIDATTGEITAIGLSPDYRSSPSCILKITASDSGQPRRQTVHYITVDAVRPSSCRRGRPSVNISFTIEENTRPGSIVGYLSSSEYLDDINGDNSDVVDTNSGDVTDPESGTETFWLVAGNALDTFSVDSITGALVIGGAVNYEVCSRYGLVVRTFSGVGKCVGQLIVEVVVVNVNDNPPQFDVDLTYITIREATPVGAVVYAPTAHDADGSRLLFELGAGQSSAGVTSWLAVDDVTGHVVIRRPLTDAPRQMHVVITATDDSDDVSNDVGRHMTSMTLVVTVVKDAASSCNRGQGLAGDRTQRVTVVEDAEIGSIVASVTTDDVITSFCNSTPAYSIVSSSDFDKFIIDRFTGG